VRINGRDTATDGEGGSGGRYNKTMMSSKQSASAGEGARAGLVAGDKTNLNKLLAEVQRRYRQSRTCFDPSTDRPSRIATRPSSRGHVVTPIPYGVTSTGAAAPAPLRENSVARLGGDPPPEPKVMSWLQENTEGDGGAVRYGGR
jgi:hypothetical protein